MLSPACRALVEISFFPLSALTDLGQARVQARAAEERAIEFRVQTSGDCLSNLCKVQFN